MNLSELEEIEKKARSEDQPLKPYKEFNDDIIALCTAIRKLIEILRKKDEALKWALKELDETHQSEWGPCDKDWYERNCPKYFEAKEALKIGIELE